MIGLQRYVLEGRYFTQGKWYFFVILCGFVLHGWMRGFWWHIMKRFFSSVLCRAVLNSILVTIAWVWNFSIPDIFWEKLNNTYLVWKVDNTYVWNFKVFFLFPSKKFVCNLVSEIFLFLQMNFHFWRAIMLSKNLVGPAVKVHFNSLEKGLLKLLLDMQSS